MNATQNIGLLLHRIGAVMERLSERVLFEEYGLGFSQFKILYIVQDYGEVLQKDIAASLGQSEPSVTRQIKLLSSAGYVTVRKGVDDKKKHIVSLTAKGQRFTGDALMRLNTHYEPILATLSIRDQEQLLGQLQLLYLQLETACGRKS
jgi:DNA-binding MarR family transcriptional regulator